MSTRLLTFFPALEKYDGLTTPDGPITTGTDLADPAKIWPASNAGIGVSFQVGGWWAEWHATTLDSNLWSKLGQDGVNPETWGDGTDVLQICSVKRITDGTSFPNASFRYIGGTKPDTSPGLLDAGGSQVELLVAGQDGSGLLEGHLTLRLIFLRESFGNGYVPPIDETTADATANQHVFWYRDLGLFTEGALNDDNWAAVRYKKNPDSSGKIVVEIASSLFSGIKTETFTANSSAGAGPLVLEGPRAHTVDMYAMGHWTIGTNELVDSWHTVLAQPQGELWFTNQAALLPQLQEIPKPISPDLMEAPLFTFTSV